MGPTPRPQSPRPETLLHGLLYPSKQQLCPPDCPPWRPSSHPSLSAYALHVDSVRESCCPCLHTHPDSSPFPASPLTPAGACCVPSTQSAPRGVFWKSFNLNIGFNFPVTWSNQTPSVGPYFLEKRLQFVSYRVFKGSTNPHTCWTLQYVWSHVNVHFFLWM